MECLGDAILELVVSDFLFKNFPDYKEGDLTSFRAALVKTESLAYEAKRLALYEFLYLSKGEESSGGRTRPYILANTFEALIGAIYMDNPKNGLSLCSEFILRELCYKIERIIAGREDIDAKTKLQELAQEKLRITPVYKLISATGPDHNKTFEMSAIGENFEFGQGEGKSKQEAEQQAAVDALNNWDEMIQLHFK